MVDFAGPWSQDRHRRAHGLNKQGARATLRALANPARRAMLELVWDAERTSSEIAEAVGAPVPGRQRTAGRGPGGAGALLGARLGRLSEAVAADREQGPAGGMQ